MKVSVRSELLWHLLLAWTLQERAHFLRRLNAQTNLERVQVVYPYMYGYVYTPLLGAVLQVLFDGVVLSIDLIYIK